MGLMVMENDDESEGKGTLQVYIWILGQDVMIPG
jgi:hypothetical protein